MLSPQTLRAVGLSPPHSAPRHALGSSAGEGILFVSLEELVQALGTEPALEGFGYAGASGQELRGVWGLVLRGQRKQQDIVPLPCGGDRPWGTLLPVPSIALRARLGHLVLMLKDDAADVVMG